MVFLGTALAILNTSTTGSAATAFVIVGTNNTDTFTPKVTNIVSGDSVVWVWASSGVFGNHNTASGTNGVPSGLWASTTNVMPFFFTNHFNSTGTFRYYCALHFATPNFMTGAVVVASANLPPTVAITNPVPGAVFAAPANLTIQATAADDGAVTNVQFRVGATVVTNKATAPFAAITDSLAAGSYTLFAIASDNNGATATNQVAISVVNPVAMSLSTPQPVSPTMFRFSYTADAGLSYVIQRSTNLVSSDWTTLVTNLADSGLINFTDLTATLPDEYYRVGRLPNP